MKINFTASVCIIMVTVFCFTSCKKDGVKTTAQKPSSTATAELAMMVRMAVNFYKSVTGAYGGADLKNGLKITSVAPSAHRGLVTMDINPLCGTMIDTTSDNTITQDTTRYHYAGQFAFTYTCSATSVDGYKNDDSFFTSTRSTNVLDSIYAEQHFTVMALDNTYKLVSLNGTDNIFQADDVFNGPYYTYGTITINTDQWSTYAQYKFTDVKVDASNGVPDMVGGQAALSYYYSQANKYQQNPDYFTTTYATFTFLGNYIARVDIGIPILPPTATYKVNVLTGQIVN